MRGRSFSARWVVRGGPRVAVVAVVLLVLTLALPQQGQLKSGGFPLGWLRNLLTVSISWATPIPPGPHQVPGTVDGRGHNASSAATRAGGGAGQAKGNGKGEIGEYAPAARKFTAGPSATGRAGFDAASSDRVASKSTATSTYYHNADGSVTQTYATSPVNYRDSAGNYQPIDTTLKAAANGRFTQRANSSGADFAATASDPTLVTIALDGGHTVKYGLTGAAPVAGTANGSTVTYASALPGTDLRLSANNSGMTEDLVLHSPGAGNSWQFPLDLGGLTASIGSDGAVELRDPARKLVGRIPNSYAYDSKVNPKSGEPATTHATSYALSTVDGKTVLTLTVDKSWLDDKARVYPVTVDPTIGFSSITTYVSSVDRVDHSMEDFIKIGSYDSGTTSDISLLKFPGLGIDGSQISVTTASLKVFVTHANGCPTAERFDVAPVTSDWSPSTAAYPGPTLGASIGNLTAATPSACANTAIDPTVGDSLAVPLSVATFNSWATGATNDYGLAIYAATTDAVHWKYLGSANTSPPSLSLTYTGNVLPQIIAQHPANGTGVKTLTPQLSAEGTIDGDVVGPGTDGGPQYEYQVFDAAGAKVVDSGNVNSAYTVPAGKLRWGQSYTWEVQAFDGANYTPNPTWYQFTTQVPQPAITSSLAQNDDKHGFDPSIGNYTTESTDAEVSTVGPSLSVVRDYNSRDPRATGAFGAAWSTIYDSTAVEKSDSTGAISTVIITYPDGSQVGYARNPDGTFSAPSGRSAKVVKLSNGYELIDKSGTSYAWTTLIVAGQYGLSSVTDASNRVETFTWASGHVTTATSAVSGRALHLTWATPSGATNAHVSTVVTDPAVTGQSSTAFTWTYNYTGDQLTSVCPPATTTACTKYGYNTGSPYHTQTMDGSPKAYWPLTETTGSVASDAVIANEGADNGVYSNVTLNSVAGPLTGSSTNAPTFNGTSSYVAIPNIGFAQNLSQSVSVWFKTSAKAAGVLFSSSDMGIKATATSGGSNPTLYMGTSGYLYGEYWTVNASYSATPIKSPKAVNDGLWHHVVLTGTETSQVMYLDGAKVSTTLGGWGLYGNLGATMPGVLGHTFLGAGYLGGGQPWPDNPYTDDQTTLHAMYFNGSIADASYYDSALTADDVTGLYKSATRSTSLLTSITRPSGNAYATATYDATSNTVTSVTDENGGKWVINTPTVTGTSNVYRTAVLGAGPTAYYRLGEASGASQAISEVKYGSGAYNAVTLGGTGRFADEPAASFNGTTSSIALPTGLVNDSGGQSYGLWFKTTSTTGGVLLSNQASALGSTTCPCEPILWLTSDGKLRGLAPSTLPLGPVTSGIAGQCLDDWASGTADKNIIDIYDCNGSDAQSFTMMSDGSVRVFGKCLDIVSSGTANGALVQLYTCNNSVAQVWQPYNGGLRNPNSGKCLDDPSSKGAGTQLQIYTCNGSNAQKWIASLASTTKVNDGNWHQAVLTSDGSTESLYVDGVMVQNSISDNAYSAGPQAYSYLGAGYTGVGWSGLTASTTSYFAGGLGEAAFYRSALSGAAVTNQFQAAHNSLGLAPVITEKVTDPNNATLTYQYDPQHGGRTIATTDGRGYTTSYGYDDAGFQHTVTDPNSAVTTTGHDDDGNEVTKTVCQNRAANLCSTIYRTYQPNTQGDDQAKGATVTASTSSAVSGWSTGAVVDGNTASVSDSHGWSSASGSSSTTNQWIQLDLGTARPLDQIQLHPRTDDGYLAAGFPVAFTVTVSADGTTWSNVTTQTAYAKPTSPNPAVFPFVAQNVRYIKVNATKLGGDGGSGYAMQLAEITALNDLPDPMAGALLTEADGRSSSADDTTYMTSYNYDAKGNVTSIKGPAVGAATLGRSSTIAYTDGTSVYAGDTGFAPASLPYQTKSMSGATQLVTYNHNGDVAATTDASGQLTRYTYDNLGRVLTKTVGTGKPTAWWRLNQTTGTAALDSSGSAHTATTTNVTWSGGVAAFNGTSSVINSPDPGINTAASYTMSAWVNLTATPTAIATVVAMWGTDTTAAELSYDGGWKFQNSDQDGYYTNTPYIKATAAATTGAWTHLVGVYDASSGTMSLYVNGQQSGGQVTTNSTWAASRAQIGSTALNGSVANVQLYQRALTSTEVSTLYGAGYAAGTATDNASGKTTTYGYDGADQVTSEIDPQVTNRITGAVHTPHTTTVFDADGNIKSQTVADDTGGDSSRATSNVYNKYDQLQSTTDQKNYTTSYSYDAYGNKSSQTDALGNITAYAYDANGNLLTQSLTNYTGDPVNPQAAKSVMEESRSYDPAGRLASITNAMVSTTSYTYTDDGLPVTATRTDKDGNNPFVLRTDTYDAAGNVVKEVTNNGATTTLTAYDAASRPVSSQEDPTGLNRITKVAYNLDDKAISSTRTDSTGSTVVTSLGYDTMGRTTSKTVTSDTGNHPLAWWKLTQGYDKVVPDASGMGYTGTPNASMGFTASDSGAWFNGGGDIASTGPVLNTQASYSVSAWVDLGSVPTTDQTAVSQDANYASGFYLQYDSTDKAWAFGQPAADAASTTLTRAHGSSQPSANTWYHLVGTYDASTGAMSLYINGNPDGTANNTKPIASSGAFMMGRAKLNGSTEYFGGGFMADVQVYQRTLSSTDVKTLYANGRTGGTVSSSTRQPTTTWRLDERGLPLSMNDANNNRTYYTYDEAGHLTVTTSPTVSVESNGGTAVSSRAVTTRGYNNFGEQTESQDANGNITTTVYDANGQSVSTTGASYTPPGSSTPIVPVTVRTYNALGQITDVSDPLSHNTHDDFDQLGDLAQTIDANGGVTHSTYDLNGQRLSTTDPTGAQTTATYDYLGRQLTAGTVERFPSSATYTTVNSYAASTKDPGGAWVNSTTSPSGVVTSYGYDALGEQTSATDGGGDTSTFTYDYLGRTTAMGLADGSSTRKSYDESGDTVATSTLDTTGSVLSATSASYDNVGNMLTSTDSRQTVTKFTYDALGNLTKEQQPTAAATATTAALAITTTVGYDAAGNKTRFTDGRGNSWIYTVNSWNMPESEIEPATTTYTTATDRTITTSYDAVGNAVKQVQPGGILLTNGYDPMHQIKTMSGTGAAAATADHGYDYDGDGRLKTATSTAAGAASATSEAFTYNDRGEVLTATGSAANSSFGYNNDGQMNSRTDASGITGYGYDTAGRLASVTDAVTGVQLTYGYNNLNQLKTVNYGATGDKRAYDYDSSHRLRTDTLQTSGSTTIASIVYGYDLNNNLTSKTTTGYGNAATNTYTYDLADRLTSWTAGSTTTGYAYDDSGNRTQVGANVYTYDARDELTGDGNNTYTYTAAGTTATQTTSSGTVKTTSDAYGQAITQGTETYAYDALGRLLTATPNGGTANQLSYSGPSNAVAADNSNKYSRDPDGGLVGIGSTSTTGGVLALTDQHTDVVGDFSATGTALSGSTSYDPLGNVLATISQAGHLGYQSGWTDPATKQVNMAARWYNPGTGQFTSRDTVEQSTSPNSASFNPFAYGADSPMTSVDPSGHGWWSTVKSWGSTAWHGVVSAWHVTTHFVSTYIIHPIAVVYHAAYNAAAKQIAAWHRQSQRLWDNFVKQYQAMQARLAQNAHIRALNAAIKRKWAAASHVVRTAYHYTAKAVTATKTFVQHHAAAIGSFVVSTAVFMGCEAVLGVATGGAGAVVGAVACGALAGAVGGLFDQGAKCVDGQKGACSAASFARSAVVGGVVGGLSGLGGAVGGKVLRSVGGKALGAVGGIFGRGSTEVGEGLAEGTAVDAASSTADTAAETMGESGANDVAEAAAPHGGEVPRGEDPSVSEPTERPSAGDEEEGSPSCTVPVHSFTGSTKVLTADGGGKPIDQIKVGDKVRDAVPGGSKDETHTVQAVIVTTTDHDFVDLTVAPKKSDGTGGKTALKVATGLLAAAATLVPAQGGTLTTTFHHPFYDRTRAAFVEAKDLKVGDELQTPDGGTTTVTALRLYHTNAVTYDLTIDGLHTYYVAAGDTPILVHNCGKKTPRVAEARQQAGAALRNANWHPRTFDLGGGRSLTLTRERMVHIMTRHMQEFFTGKPTTDQSFFPAGTTIDDVTSLVGKAISGNRPQLRALLESGGGQMDARIDGQDYQMGVGGMRDIIGQFFPK